MRYQLRKIDLESAALGLPTLKPLSIRGAHYDVGIFPLGFEDRCLALADRCVKDNVTIDRKVVVIYPGNAKDNETNWPQLSESLGKIPGNGVERVSVQDMRSWVLNDSHLGESGSRVIVDTSGSSNSLTMRLVWAFLERDVSLTLGFGEAKQYFPLEPATKRPTARGMSGLDVSVEHPGLQSGYSRDSVILVPGFDKDRARKVLNWVDPVLLTSAYDQVTWVLGVPHLKKDRWRVDELRAIHELGDNSPWHNVTLCSTFDYLESWRTLEAIYQDRKSDDRFTLSPMGSKLQAIGSALFCHSRSDVRVVFSLPKSYSTKAYSFGIRRLWQLDFESTQSLRTTVESVDSLEVIDTDSDQVLLSGTERVWQ